MIYIVTRQIYRSTMSVLDSIFPMYLPEFVTCFVIMVILTGMSYILNAGLVCISQWLRMLMFFICLLAIVISHPEKCLFISLAHLLIPLPGFLVFSFVGSLCSRH